MSTKYNVAVIGATGNVGREIVNILAERSFPINKLYVVASDNSMNTELSFGDDIVKTISLNDLNFDEVDMAFFCAGSDISKKYIPKATAQNCIAIDKSSFFRLDAEVPLIVPEANLAQLKNYSVKNIIANPNCCTIPLSVVLKPLDNEMRIKRVVVSTYQSVSGAGKAGMDELFNQTKSKYTFGEVEAKIFPKQIAFNLFPCIGYFNEDGYTSEEAKIALELKKIIGNHIGVSVTCVRVPVFVSHSMAVNIEFEGKMDATEAEEILKEADGIITISKLNEVPYITPIEASGEDSVYVTRIRNDETQLNTINLWISCDNLRKGAALNGVQIAEELIKSYL
ncbi:aspartate-semialdehyde dehydrogenase [Rickettsia endosymbiont of Halotydeus destructor]|uniref:aspartate-semialdehyde dehydrogenase n=1 Tax=Rickettsia endosymbiont of Halotydeus destructor TaxID=2996754 RepID=UPI003BAEA0D8